MVTKPSKPAKPKKLRIYVDLDVETAEAFEAIKAEIEQTRGVQLPFVQN